MRDQLKRSLETITWRNFELENRNFKMPALVERENITPEMMEKLRRHIVKERERRKQGILLIIMLL